MHSAGGRGTRTHIWIVERCKVGNSKRNLHTHTDRCSIRTIYALYVVLLIYILVVSRASSRSSKLLSFRLKCRRLSRMTAHHSHWGSLPRLPAALASHLTVCGNSSLVSLIATESPNATIRQIWIRIRKQFSRRQNRATLPFRVAFHALFRIRIVLE